MNQHEKPRLEVRTHDHSPEQAAFVHVSFHMLGCGVGSYFIIDGNDHDSIEALKSSLDTAYRQIQGWEERMRCQAIIDREHTKREV